MENGTRPGVPAAASANGVIETKGYAGLEPRTGTNRQHPGEPPLGLPTDQKPVPLGKDEDLDRPQHVRQGYVKRFGTQFGALFIKNGEASARRHRLNLVVLQAWMLR